MQIDPEEHERRQQIQIIPRVFPEYFQYPIPSDHDYDGKNMGPCQPVKSGGNDYDGNDQDIGNDVPSVDAQHSEKQGVGKRNQEDKKKDNSGEAKCPMKQGHDHFGKPFVGSPLRRWGKKGEDIVAWHGKCLQDVFSRPDVVAGVRIVQEDRPRLEGEEKEHDQEKGLTDRGD
jgi:hypothetical protein